MSMRKLTKALGYMLVAIAPMQNISAQFYDSSCCQSCDDCCSSSRFSVYADYLYWHIAEDNLDFIREHGVSSTPFDPETSTGFTENNHEVVHGPHFKWDSGFRVGLGYEMPCEGWNVDLNWIHFNTNAHGRARGSVTEQSLGVGVQSDLLIADDFFGPGSIAGFPLLENLQLEGLPNGFGQWGRAAAHWRLKFNVVDATIAKSIDVCSGVTVSPYIGARYVNIRQRYHINYASDNLPPIPALHDIINVDLLITQTGFNHLESKYQAGGLIGGISGKYDLGCGLGLYSSFGGGVVYGNAHASSHQHAGGTFTIIQGSVSENENVAYNDRWKRRHNQLVGILDLAVGAEWTPDWFDCAEVAIKIGYEFHKYFDQNFFRLFNGNTNVRGNLGLHGLTVGAKVSF